MPLSTVAHNAMLNELASLAVRVHLLNTIQLDASASSSATSIFLDTAVALGDEISLNNEAGERETFTITANPGTNPTLDHALVNGYEVNTEVGLAPKLGTSLLLADADGESIGWLTASGQVLNKNATNPEFAVGTGQKIGAFALYNSIDSIYYGSFLTNNIEEFGAAGTYILTAASVTLES